MTPLTALLWGTCLLTASVLLMIVQAGFDYVVAFLTVSLWIVALTLSPIWLFVAAFFGAERFMLSVCDDFETDSNYKPLFFITSMIILTFEFEAARLSWPVLSRVYSWQPDIDHLSVLMGLVSGILIYILMFSGVVLVLSAICAEFFNQRLLGIESESDLVFETTELVNDESV